ncbi:MAG: response regulator [Thermodesulfovibrionales bacterium]
MDKSALIFCDIMNEKATGEVTLKEVLVIDDEDYILDILRLVISRLGYSVRAVSDGEEAIKLISNGNFWAIFCDLMMPGIDGLEIYEKISDLRPGLKDRFVLLTGTVFDKKTKDFIEKCGIRTLLKPFKFEDVNEIIKELEKAYD